MKKRPQSIDGFVLRRRENQEENSLNADAQIREKKVPKKPVVQPILTAENLDDEIESSLENLGDGDDHKLAEIPDENAENPGENENNSQKKPKKLSRKEKKLAKKEKNAQKKHKKLRKFAKILAILVPVALVILAGYLLVKALMTGSKVFQGNIIDAFTTKTKLQEDGNGWTNILLASTSGYSMDPASWDGATLTDSIMVLSVNQETNQAYTMSFPRDLWVTHADCSYLGTTSGKLNEVYTCGSDGGENEAAGMKALMVKISEITGLDIQYYAHPNWQAVVQIVDAVGGVDVEINSDDSRGIYDVATKVQYPNGTAHLDGQAALALARARGDMGGYGLAGGNFDREKYQREILAAVQKKAVSAGTLLNPAAVSSLLDAVGGNLITSFKSSEIQTLIDLAKNVKTVAPLPFNSRPNGETDLFTTGYIGEISVVLPMAGQGDFSEIQAYIAKNLSNDPVVQESATIDVLNGSDVSGAAKNVADDLKSAKFTIGATDNYSTNISGKVEIYDLSGGKMSGTSAALAKKYGVKVQSGAPANYASADGASFVVIVGAELANSFAAN